MEQSNKFIDQFNQLETLEPSANWESALFNKIELSANARKERGNSASKGLFILSIILRSANLFIVTRDQLIQHHSVEPSKYKTIATEFMISTSSSKF